MNNHTFGEWLEESWNNSTLNRSEVLEGQFEKQDKYQSLEAYINNQWAWHLEREHRESNNGI